MNNILRNGDIVIFNHKVSQWEPDECNPIYTLGVVKEQNTHKYGLISIVWCTTKKHHNNYEAHHSDLIKVM